MSLKHYTVTLRVTYDDEESPGGADDGDDLVRNIQRHISNGMLTEHDDGLYVERWTVRVEAGDEIAADYYLPCEE